MEITNEDIIDIFEEDGEILVELFESSDFTSWEDFFIYTVQNYFNFLELDKNIDPDKNEILKEIFSKD